MSKLPLSRFKVIDLTRVRAGPTCVRQLADWGADVHQDRGSPRATAASAATRNGPDFQNLHRNKRSLTLNLKKPEGVAILKQLVGRRRRAGREFPARREIPPRHRLREPEADQPAPGLCQHLGLRPGRALSRPSRLRPDRPGHGRADVDHRPAGPGAGARRHSRSPISPPASSPPWAS